MCACVCVCHSKYLYIQEEGIYTVLSTRKINLRSIDKTVPNFQVARLHYYKLYMGCKTGNYCMLCNGIMGCMYTSVWHIPEWSWTVGVHLSGDTDSFRSEQRTPHLCVCTGKNWACSGRWRKGVLCKVNVWVEIVHKRLNASVHCLSCTQLIKGIKETNWTWGNMHSSHSTLCTLTAGLSYLTETNEEKLFWCVLGKSRERLLFQLVLLNHIFMSL